MPPGRRQRGGAPQARRAAGLLGRPGAARLVPGGLRHCLAQHLGGGGEIAAGRLVAVLEDYAAPPNGIYVVFPQRKHMPLRVRLWIDFLKHNYSQPGFSRKIRRCSLSKTNCGLAFVASPCRLARWSNKICWPRSRPSWKPSPGAGAKAAFESPKVAAHGDFACTAAMQLAKPLKLNPRQLGEQLCAPRWRPRPFTSAGWMTSTSRAPASQHPPQARRQAGSGARGAGAGERFGYQPRNGSACWSNSSRPTPPARCTWAMAARPPGRRHLQPVRHPGLERAPRVLLQRRRRADQTLANSTQLRAKGFKPGDDCWPTDPTTR
jgi:hypothetical protein